MTITVIRPTRIDGAGPIPRGTCLGKQDPDCSATQHGTYSAYKALGCRCPHAREAKRIYLKRIRENRSEPRHVDSTGTRRRLRALCAIGWRAEDMAEHLGTTRQNVQKMLCDGEQPVFLTTAARVRVLYDRLSSTAGSSEITRQRSAAKGWVPPLAWDDATIDDPDAKPNLGDTDTEQDGYDPITVALAVDGRLTYQQIRPHYLDLIEVVRRLARRMNDQEIADHLHWHNGHSGVCQLRNRNNIPGPDRHEAVYAYGTRSRARKAA